jgi:hypothetical protein
MCRTASGNLKENVPVEHHKRASQLFSEHSFFSPLSENGLRPILLTLIARGPSILHFIGNIDLR